MSRNLDELSDWQKAAPWNSGLASGEKMQRLDRLASLGLLSASMAHEIKNSLVAVKTFVDVLAQKNEDEELTSVVARELDRINALATQILKFAAPRCRQRSPVCASTTRSIIPSGFCSIKSAGK